MIPPLMISRKDDELVGAANRSDPMGVLAVWSARARDIVPHLTEQTTDVRAFQILVEAFRLWEMFSAQQSLPADRLREFFMLVEQAFARMNGWIEGDWRLPGARRVRSRSGEQPHISIVDATWHLLDGQLANGIWGLYRGASVRAGLLDEGMAYLSEETRQAAESHTFINEIARDRLFRLVSKAIDGETVPLPAHGNDSLYRALRDTFCEIPLKEHLQAKFIDGHSLNRALAGRLAACEHVDRRSFAEQAASELDEHHQVLQGVIDCENLLAVIEGIFYWLCCCKGETLEDASASLPVDLARIEAARMSFAASGLYAGETAASRHTRIHEHLDTSGVKQLARSIIALHQKVSDERGRMPWLWLEDDQRLQSDADVAQPTKAELDVELAWRNDYYLHPLRSIALQLKVGT
ncbi:MAG: hypothetical protein F4X31_13260 [Gammaproteobacteria bacterium]|nr:hypothetical protein [Gammaproteobacteria bacterium]